MIQFWAHPTLGKAWHLAFDRISTTLLSMSYLPVRVPVLHIQDWSWNRRKQLCCPEHLKFVCCSETNCWIRGIGLSDDSTGIVYFSLRIDSLRRAINFWIFLRQGLVFFGSWFYAFLFFVFSAFCFFCFLLFLLLCFSCFSALPASFLFCFSAFPASLLFCFCASVPFYFYYSTGTCSFLQSCVFAALLPAPLLLCFLSLLPLCLFPLCCVILSCLYPK